jgi:hypothetical protein
MYNQPNNPSPDSPARTIGYSQSTKYMGNPQGTMKANYGRGPTVGNNDRDNNLKTVDTVTNPTAKSGKINGGRSWAPSAGQNYKGNPDKINVGRGPTTVGKK